MGNVMRRVSISTVIVLLLTLLLGTGWALYSHFPATVAQPENKKINAGSTASGRTDTAAMLPLATAKPAPAEDENTKPTKKSSSSPIDVALIDPKGTSVIAGSAVPNSEVVVTADGIEVGKIVADSNGDWVLTTDHRFKSPSPDIGVENRKPAEVAKSALANQSVDSDSMKKSADRIEKPTNLKKPAHSPEVKVVDRLTEEFMKIVDAARQEEGLQNPNQEESVVAEHNPKRSLPAPAKSTDKTPELAGSVDREPVTRVKRVEADGRSPADPRNTVDRDAAEVQKPELENKIHLAIPIPIGFEYRTSTFTEQGKKAAKLLVEYLAIKKPSSISLTGHADERGSKMLNMKLSRERLNAVAREVKTQGYFGKLLLIPKGEEEPYTGVDRSKHRKQELYVLDRRVELRLFE